ncbi:MAG: clostripain [Clostridia bacterium]|nr:clostripain [Clostridia bacterium]
MKRILAGALALLLLAALLPSAALAHSISRKSRASVTVMMYIDGSDLEEDDGSATADINEMLYADVGDNVNVILCTGGAKKWQNSIMNAETNEYYRIQNGRLVRLKDAGLKDLTDAATLGEFVSFCAENYPADRNILVMWDHGGGSLYGFGVDDRFPGFHMMSLDDLGDALDETGVHFDFIGFDACLMATAETAISVAGCADYLIASEEMEPNTGWYYTDWLTSLSADPDIDTETLGRGIIDDFMKKSLENDSHDTLTLSLVDLDRFQDAVLPQLWAFSGDASKMIDDGSFAVISRARSGARSYGSGDYDQVDLMDFASRVGTDAASALIEALTDAVVYSRATRNREGSSGMAIYFPYEQPGELAGMLKTYDGLGWDESYLSLISSFATVQAAGRQSGKEGDASGYAWYDADLADDQTEYITNNQLDGEELLIRLKNDDYYALTLKDEDWDLIVDIQLQVYLDDGEGYIELGSDDVFSFDEDGDLIVDYDFTWVTLNGETVTYYAEDYVSDGDYYCYSGYVPIEFNGRDAELILNWDSDHDGGFVRGVRLPSVGGASARGLVPLRKGDVIRPVCQYYDYNGDYVDEFFLGEGITVDGEIAVTYDEVGYEETAFCYMLVDIYGNSYWTEYVYS